MNLSRCGIVITSIYDTGWIERISENILSSNEQDNVKIFYISDNKTPAVCLEKIKVASKKGIKFWAPSKDEQIIFQKKIWYRKFYFRKFRS